jgi:SulP family sulfate permease
VGEKQRTTSFVREALAAAITAAVAITYSLSYGALIFAGPLAPQLGQGISMMLMTAAVSGIVVALTSSFRFAIAGADSNATAVLATLAAGIAVAMPNDPVVAAHDVLLALMLSALLGGVTLVALGTFRMGRWIRYIPYPIVAGFLAASGWLLLNGSLRVIADVSIPTNLDRAFTALGAEQLATGFTIATVLYATRHVRNPLLLPGILLAGSAIVDGVFFALGSFGRARAEGWLVPAFGAPHLTSIAAPSAYANITWPAIGDIWPAMATAIGVTVIAILFGAAGLEAQTGLEADLDRELRASGLASIASALCGGSLGSLSSSRTILNRSAGAHTRVSGVLVGLASAAALTGGSPVVSLVPRPVLGGMLLYLGFALLREWLGTSWRRLSRSDVLLVVAIIAVTALASFIAALAIGLIFSCISFVIRYGRFRALRHTLTARQKRSRVERSAAERAVLDAHGDRIRMLILQGYIFFGTANSVIEETRAYLDRAADAPAKYLILDFTGVSGIDSSAANSFAKLVALGRKIGTEVLFCSLSDADYAVLARAGDIVVRAGAQNMLIDLDHALEYCEDELLATTDVAAAETLEDWLAREFGDSARARRFLGYFNEVRVQAYKPLFRRGDPSDSLYLVHSGRLRVSINDHGTERRLRSMVAGSIIGEMGLFSREPRSADVVAEQDATLLRLDHDALARLNDEEPGLANAFQAMLFRLQADRLRFANAEIAALEA